MSTKLVLPLLLVLPDKPGNPVTTITAGYTINTCECGATYTDSGVGINPPIDPDPPVEYSLRNSNVTVTTEHHEYVYASGKLLREIITTTDAEGNTTTETLDFTYDASGSPFSLTYNGTTYYYVVNLQGDVIRLVSGTGVTVAEYWYDPYGHVASATGAMAEMNPLRYRGYCYDEDTAFYYLQSRYYDSTICRFINADGYASTGQGFLGCNMFAYCSNCPVVFSDYNGNKIVICFDGASEEDIKRLLSFLCKLSDDIIKLVGNELHIVHYKNGGHSAGTQLLRELIASKHTITIMLSDSGWTHYAPDSEYVIERNRPKKLPITEPVGGILYFIYDDLPAGTSGTISIGHELIHAYRFSHKYTLLPHPNDDTSFNCKLEEVYTVGLDPENYYSAYNENGIRSEHGLPARTEY